jgi:hypothetical protein
MCGRPDIDGNCWRRRHANPDADADDGWRPAGDGDADVDAQLDTDHHGHGRSAVADINRLLNDLRWNVG